MENCLVTTLKAEVQNPNLPVFNRIYTVSVTVPANTSAQSVPSFVSALTGKKVMVRIVSSSPSESCILSLTGISTLSSTVGAPFNLNLTSLSGCRITSETGGTFTLEYSTVFDWGKNININNVGVSCYIDTNSGKPIYSGESWASNSLISALIPKPSVIKFNTMVVEPSSHVIKLGKYDSDGITYLGSITINVSDSYDTSEINAAYLRLVGNVGQFVDDIILTDYQ